MHAIPHPPLPTRACINQQLVTCACLDVRAYIKNVVLKALQAEQEILANVGVPSEQVAAHLRGILSYSMNWNLLWQWRWHWLFIVFVPIHAFVRAKALPIPGFFLPSKHQMPVS